MFYDTESTEDKMLEANPILGRSLTTGQGAEKILKLLGQKGQALFKVLLVCFSQRNKILSFSMKCFKLQCTK